MDCCGRRTSIAKLAEVEGMKVVLFCGGLGTRLREYGDNVPKPLVPLGYRPVLWHVMKYYAHFGHTDFILCLGYRADRIKEYFLNYNECLSNDFQLKNGGRDVKLLRSDIQDWTITFVDTGLNTPIGQRLAMVREHVDQEEIFLANYADGLTDLPLPEMVQKFVQSKKMAACICVVPSQTFHVVGLGRDGVVQNIKSVREAGILINGGYFVFRKGIFDYIKPGEDLIEQPFRRLMRKRLLLGYRYERFWCMDTFREQQELSDWCVQGRAPWMVWRAVANSPATPSGGPEGEKAGPRISASE
jgi:glucose-1-phosphate cytidylyltransferase